MLANLNEFFMASPMMLYVFAGLLGLTVGSFLNVVIYRLPIMMKKQWEGECHEVLGLEPNVPAKPFNLFLPHSACPACGHQVRFWENVPVLSYLFLKGRCSACGIEISAQYPLVEFFTALASIFVVATFGYSWAALFALLFTWALITLAMIDLQTQLLPDQITLPLVWLGLLVNLNGLFTDYASALWGAAGGYIALRAVYHMFKLLTGKEGMGFGDFKLLAAIGAWGGWQILPATIIISSLIGAIVGIAMISLKKHEQGTPIPFGPFLAAAGWVAFFWGDTINQIYLKSSGLA